MLIFMSAVSWRYKAPGIHVGNHEDIIMLIFLSALFVGFLTGYVTCSLMCINQISKLPHDRRRQHEARFPLIDCDGNIVFADRRQLGLHS
jgi:hypothetical protein